MYKYLWSSSLVANFCSFFLFSQVQNQEKTTEMILQQKTGKMHTIVKESSYWFFHDDILSDQIISNMLYTTSYWTSRTAKQDIFKIKCPSVYVQILRNIVIYLWSKGFLLITDIAVNIHCKSILITFTAWSNTQPFNTQKDICGERSHWKVSRPK